VIYKIEKELHLSHCLTFTSILTPMVIRSEKQRAYSFIFASVAIFVQFNFGTVLWHFVIFWNCSEAFCYFLEVFCGILLFFRTVLWHFVILWNCSVAFCYFLELLCGILLFFRTVLWHFDIF
jgi:hypothetical protein